MYSFPTARFTAPRSIRSFSPEPARPRQGMGRARKRPRAAWRGLLLILAPLIVIAPVAADETLVLTADSQYSFAESLAAEGRFDRAADEFERFSHFFPDDPRSAEALVRAGRSRFEAGQPRDALLLAERVMSQPPPESPTLDTPLVGAHFLAAEIHARQGEAGQSITVLSNLLALNPTPSARDEAFYRMGWVWMDGFYWDRARWSFVQVEEGGSGRYPTAAILDRLDGVADLPRKEPALAGLLALVPGAGHAYCGRYQDALVALVLNGALGWAAVEAASNDSPALAGVLGLVGTGFYVGNIYGAIGAAHKANQETGRAFVEDIRRSSMESGGLAFLKNGFMISFEF